MSMQSKISDDKLQTIMEKCAVYVCACPAQVAQQITHLRELYDYQQACLARPNNLDVHRLISEATTRAHDILEKCLFDIMAVEQWDMETLEMPEGLRQLIERDIKSQ